MANKGTSGQHGPAAQSIRLSATEGANMGFSKKVNEKVSSFIKPTAKPTIMPHLKQPIPQPQPQNRVVIPLRPGETLEKQGTTPFLKQPQNTTEGGNNEAPDTSENPETEKEVTVDEAQPKKYLTLDEWNELPDDEKEARISELDPADQKKLEDQKQSEQSNNNRTAGEIGKRQHDEDEREDDDDKFEIKEGDFIDFLMKEIVLASASYVGKKVAGGANYLLYKSGSWVYHDVLGKGVDKVVQTAEDTCKAIKQRHKEIQENSGEYLIPLNVIEGTSNEELRKLYKEHNKDIKSIMKGDKSALALANMAKELFLTGTIKADDKGIWIDPETETKIDLNTHPYVKELQQKYEQISKNSDELGLTPEQKKNHLKVVGTDIALKISETTDIQLKMNLFAENMATAQMIQDKLNGNPNPKSKEEYIVEYQATYIALRKKIRQKENLPENIKKEEDLVNLSEKALKEGYKHDNEQGYTNKFLLTIQGAVTQKDLKEFKPETLIAAAKGAAMVDITLDEKLKESSNLVSTAGAAKDAQDQKRKNKPSQKQEPKKQQPISKAGSERE